ncbi:hypothetical protein V2O64_16460 [Verrucomicrobiaceae bacterium 227]
MKSHFLLTALLLLLSESLFGQSRGVWFWGSTTIPDGTGGTMSSPYGSNNVVGNPVLEADCLAFFKLHHVDRVYGSYGTRPVWDQAAIATWNEKLDCLRIESQLLLEGITVDTPADITNYLDKISARLIDFNDAFTSEPAKQFDALHLDIEPQQTPPYQGGSAGAKRLVLEDLLNCYAAIRNHLDVNGYAHIPVYADIPYTWDKIPGSIAWADAADRDVWFASLKDYLAGTTIMTFSKDTAAELDVATAYERAGVLDGFARIAIQPKVGVVDPPNIIWPDYPTFNGVLNDLEDLIEEDETTDIENLGLWRHAIDSTGLGYTLRNRGLWFWEYNPFDHATSHIYGSLSVVGHAARENEAVTFMANRQVRTLFGEYSQRPESEPAVIAAWNTKLHHARIDSQSLIAVTDLTLVARLQMLAQIETSLMDFNNALGVDEPSKFDSLRLHLAPQKSASWATMTASARKAELDTLLSFLADARSLLDTSGYEAMPLFADLGHDWDVLPFDGGQIAWANAADRDAWFANLHQIVDGVSILSFEQDNVADIKSASNYERSSVLPTKARIGMRSAVGSGEVWPSSGAFHSGMALVENSVGAAESVDIDSYIQWREAVEHSGPVIGSVGLEAVFDFDKPTRPVIVVNVLPNHLYIVRFSTDLEDPKQAREVAKFRTSHSRPERMEIPLQVRGERGFWLIERIKD